MNKVEYLQSLGFIEGVNEEIGCFTWVKNDDRLFVVVSNDRYVYASHTHKGDLEEECLGKFVHEFLEDAFYKRMIGR